MTDSLASVAHAVTKGAGMSGLEASSMVSGFVGTIVGGFSVWLALHLYTKSKDTESHVKEALAGIRAQTDALQALTGKMLNRLTTAVTAPRPADEAFVLLATTIQNIPTAIAANLRAPAADATVPALRAEVLNAYVVSFFYAGVANVASQAYLPPLDSEDDGAQLQRIVDHSAATFAQLEGLIGAAEEPEVETSPFHAMYVEALTQWKPHIKDSVAVYRERQSAN